MIVSIILITLTCIVIPLLICFATRTSSSTDIEIQQLAEKRKEIANHYSNEVERRCVSMISVLRDYLKPCPVCGGKPRVEMITDYTYDLEKQTRYHVGCLDRCGQVFSCLDLHNLVESWNHYAEGILTEKIPDRPAIKPKSTNCPNCGAPVDIHAEKCAYCDTPYI